ncbi:MAG: glycosyltransferase [Armatimonadetes bacterium]|nr:glycosyltransferase [Armatimonadota bacterium]
MNRQVFHDPTGRRRGIFSRTLAALVFFLLILFIAFGITLVFTPNLAGLRAQFRPFRIISPPSIARSQRAHELDHIRPQVVDRKHPAKSKAPTDSIVLGFLAPWEPTSLDSFRNAAPHLTHVSPVWLRMNPNGDGIDTRDFDLKSNPNNGEIITIARRNNVRIVPILSNAMEGANDGLFDPKRVDKMLRSPTARKNLITSLVGFLTDNRLAGINLDFEDLDEYGENNIAGFLKELGPVLHKGGFELSIDVQTTADELNVKACADACDYLVLMAYDKSSEDGKPGPIAPLDWSVKQVDRFLLRAPADKVVMGVGSYAYDWKNGKAGAASLSYEEAISQADGYLDESPKDAFDFDPDSLNMHYEYVDDDDKSHHDVWLLDAVSAYNQWQSVRSKDLKGVALWSLGTEDPSIWKCLDAQTLFAPPDPKALSVIDFPRLIDFTGKGELLKVERRPQSGQRSLEIDPDTQLITDQTYEQYPYSYVIAKSGYKPKQLVLTFDDGPDPRYTPLVLDELKKLKVPGTFFLVGENCERYPDIVRRICDEGHEIGNHSFTHPDLGPLGQSQANLEINATQRAIESLTGHGTLLFRPPYNADSQPETNNQVLPVDWASALGYTVVGENIDPHDWSPTIFDENGNPKKHTAEDITEEIISQIQSDEEQHQEGNIILLHDAGGNREETIRALGMVVPKLQAMGYKFVSVAQLEGAGRDKVMPKIAPNEVTNVNLDRLAFWLFFSFQWLLATLFIVAIALGIVRIFFLLPLALVHFRRRPQLDVIPTTGPTVSVLIAAYNEESTIEATVRSVLASRYPLAEVIVVNDGSTDGTREVIDQLTEVVAIHKENGGKASALNAAIERATGELLFCIDADTQLDPDAIGRMVPYFDDEKVGAVAGNVEVGNIHNVVTSWQAVEYRTSQNLDRQAYSQLNAITVVPGAIGMWRREAVVAAQEYQSDTLAEDMDLTWRIRMLGYKIDTENRAVAYTEAPETISALFRQRFRWAFGTLQCLWKHRRALGRYGWFGRLALPTLWLFQVIFQILAPIMDVKIFFAIISAVMVYFSPVPGSDPQSSYGKIVGEAPPPKITDALLPIIVLYCVFLGLELISGWVAYKMDRKPAWRLWWLIPQRFVYRQLMYAVVLRGLWRAMLGVPQGWGKLKRTGRAKLS